MISVYGESTPNPESLKFVTNKLLSTEPREFVSKSEAELHSPLAKSILEFPFVKSVFISSNFITVLKTPAVDWYEIMNELREFIIEYLKADKPVFTDIQIQSSEAQASLNVEAGSNVNENLSAEASEMNIRIADIIDEYIRPAVESDGGAILFQSFKEGVVRVTLQGSCSGCPSSEVTLKNGIETLLKSMVPEVKEVLAAAG